MPWLAVPLHRKATHKKLTRRFQVRQIPMLVLLDAAGKTIHRDITPAVTHIIEDPEGDTFAEQFPWSEKRHSNTKEMLGETFLKGDGTEVSINELDGKYIGVLLSATWHWQCRRFQQMLEYMYEKLKGEGKQFEIIDMDFSADVPWLCMPQASFKAKQNLGEAFRVERCPMLVIIDPDGNVVTTEGVEIVTKDTDGECFPWTPKPLYDLSTLEPEILGEMNDTVTCVVLCEGCDEETKKAMSEAMMPVLKRRLRLRNCLGARQACSSSRQPRHRMWSISSACRASSASPRVNHSSSSSTSLILVPTTCLTGTTSTRITSEASSRTMMKSVWNARSSRRTRRKRATSKPVACRPRSREERQREHALMAEQGVYQRVQHNSIGLFAWAVQEGRLHVNTRQGLVRGIFVTRYVCVFNVAPCKVSLRVPCCRPIIRLLFISYFLVNASTKDAEPK